MASATHSCSVSLDPKPTSQCYCCSAGSSEQEMYACPSCGEFICYSNAKCDGRCRCELTSACHAFTSENIGKFGTEAVSFLKDENSRYVAVGENYARLFDAQIGYSDHELFGHAPAGRRMADRIRAIDVEVLETGECSEQINSLTTENGTQYWLVEKSLIFVGEAKFIAGTCRDVTSLVKKAMAVGLVATALLVCPLYNVMIHAHIWRRSVVASRRMQKVNS